MVVTSSPTGHADTASGHPATLQPAEGDNVPQSRWPYRMAVLGALLVVVALHAYVARDSSALVWAGDESGYLANGRWLAGLGSTPLEAGGYGPGYSLLLVPAWWLLGSGPEVYVWAIALNVVLAAVTVLLLARLGRGLGTPRYLALLAAVTVVVAPARASLTGYALAESLLTALVVLGALAAWRHARLPSTGSALALAVVGAACTLTHVRTLPLAVTALAWFVATLVRRRGRERAAWIGLVLGGALLVGSMLLTSAAERANASGTRSDELLGTLLELDVSALGLSALGQAFYGVVGWWGLTVLGLVLVLPALRRGGVSGTPVSRLGRWGLVSTAGCAAVSVVFISGVVGGYDRVDFFVYGRYLDPLWTLLAFAGLLALLRRVTAAAAAATLVVTVATCVMFASLIGTTPLVFPTWARINVGGMLPWAWSAPGTGVRIPVLPSTLAAVLSVTLLLAAAIFLQRTGGRHRWWRDGAVVVLAGALAAGTVVADARNLEAFDEGFRRERFSLPDVARDIPGAVALDTRSVVGDSRNAWLLWLAGRVRVFDGDEDTPRTDMVVGRLTWRERWPGARVVAADAGARQALWVRPGQLQRQLARRGWLRPGDPSTPFDAATCEPDVEAEVVSRGGTLRLTVANVRGSRPLDALGTVPGRAGTARLVLSWPAADAGPDAGLVSVVDLPHTIMPGRSLTFEAPLNRPAGADPAAVDVPVELVQERVGSCSRASGPLLVVRVPAADADTLPPP